MRRCLELALLGAGRVQPNPMVGCVIVHEEKIIGEGFHEFYGGPHAEVNALASVKNPALLAEATLYVNLEPCNHFGKTPPCTDLIIEKKIPRVVMGCLDANPLVGGGGKAKLLTAGIEVQSGLLEEECLWLNRRFFTWITQQRPYIILKWAQSADGFFAPPDRSRFQLTNSYSQQLLHRWRSEEASVLVGTKTAQADNPRLDARFWNQQHPVRIVLDREGKLSPELHLFDHSIPTIVVTEKGKKAKPHLDFFQTKFDAGLLPALLKFLHSKNLSSLLVEGGSELLYSFLNSDCWDEARIFISPVLLHEGLRAPGIPGTVLQEKMIFNDRLLFCQRKT
jgi:diaminohydroxyphosphoribosylaminopyrimidine deaminase/5-amino-6-(5-phosphoribosylamino)uracil reductase